ERPGFEADRLRLMLVGRSDGRTVGPSVEATKGWTLSVGSYIWCPDSKCLYAVVEERGRDNIYRIDLPSFHRSVAVGGGGVNTGVQVMPDGRGLVYLHQSNTQPNEVWASGRQVTHHNDAALEALDLRPLDEFGFVGALGDSVFGWVLKPPGFAPAKRYPVVYLIHGGPQGAWTDYWGARWYDALFAARGYVVAAECRAELEDADPDRTLPARLSRGPVGGLPGIHRREAAGRAGQVPVLPRRGPLGAAAAEPPGVVGNGARLDRSILEAGAPPGRGGGRLMGGGGRSLKP